MKKFIAFFLVISVVLSSCIKDDIIEDFVKPTLRITTNPDTITINSTYQFEYMYLNNIGLEENIAGVWSSSDPNIIEIDESGLATPKTIGNSDITIEYKNSEIDLKETINVAVGLTTVESSNDKGGTIQTTSSYALEGDFILKQNGNNLILEFFEDYKASSALPGLFVYLSNNRNSIANAYEISAVVTFSGAHTYSIENIDIDDYEFLVYFCKPFNVKVGDGEIN